MGSPLGPSLSAVMWRGYTFGEPHGDIKSCLEHFETVMATPLPILDVYAMSTVKAVLADPIAAARLRQFAESRGRATDIDFLQQIGQHEAAVTTVASIASAISVRFTGLAALEPVRLPLTLGKNLSLDVREASNALIPALGSIFDEAKTVVEQNLAQDVYPEFLRTQLSLNLEVIGPGYSPNEVCPGFGDAFYMTDPTEVDDPMVFISDGLANLTGYSMGDMFFKNCRLFQGPGTRGSCIDRMRNALAKNEEIAELVLNYTKDERPYWNFLFMARLTEVDGTIRYNLGGQIDVTDMVEREEDVTQLLSYVSPFPQRPAPKPQEKDLPGATCRGESKEKNERRQPRYPPSASQNIFLKTFRRRYSQPDENMTENGTDVSIPEPLTPIGGRSGSIALPSVSTVNDYATTSPYSRFVVLEYIKSTKMGAFTDKKTSRVQLPIRYCSAAALEILGPACHNLAEILGLGIFEVLSGKTNSTSVTKTFQSTVRASLAEGRTAKLDVSLGSATRSRSRRLSVTRKRSGVTLVGAETPSSQSPSLRRTLSLERMTPVSGSSSGPGDDFVSYWTPLKNDLGTVRWVVMILVPKVG